MKKLDIYVYAAVNKVRFASPRGLLTVEQLYELPLTATRGAISLDEVSAIVLDEQAATPRKSLVKKAPEKDELNEVKVAILEDVIEYVRAENARKVKAKEASKRIAQIKEALIAKDAKAITKASEKDLKKELKALQAEINA